MMELLEIAYYPVAGEPLAASALLLPKAVEMVQALQSQGLPYVRLLECRRTPEYEIVVVDIEAEVPQYPVHDVRTTERIAFGFAPADTDHQVVLALREDFPLVPHIHFGGENMPRSLCLYQTAYTDLKPTWTAAALLRQLQHWLTQTARGELHAADQALEQAFYAPAERLVLPSTFFAAEAIDLEPVRARIVSNVLGQTTLVALPLSASPPTAGWQVQFASFVYTTPPQVHGLIQEQPRTLAALQTYLSTENTDFLDALRQHLAASKGHSGFSWDHKLLLIVRMPKQRTVEGPIEGMEVWAFATIGKLAEIGTDVGIWRAQPNKVVELFYTDTTRTGQQSPLVLLNPVCALTRELAAAYNGVFPTTTRFVAIGAGSLGSQVVNNLVRAGQGNWVWLDEDYYQPHNTARHYLPGSAVGLSKAEAMASTLQSIYEQADVQAIAANVLRPVSDSVLAAYEAAEVVLDMSASVAVARHLTLGITSPGRRLSLFLNPSGTDLVLLAEPRDRTLRLDQLEMEYYQALLRQPDLQSHLHLAGRPIRYSHACRDVSVRLPQDQVALHAAIGARAVRTTVAELEARLKIWQAQPDLTVTAHEIEVFPHTETVVGDWTVSLSQQLVQELHAQRQARLPNETGGILVGVFDTQQRRLYIVDLIPSPVDSLESPTAYVRGIEGVPAELARISECTGRQVVYVGEWHSHPDGYSIRPSEDDKNLFARLQRERQAEGLPAIMAIVGEDGALGWHVATMAANEEESHRSRQTIS